MRRPRDLPIIRADVFTPFLMSARRIGVPVEKHLQLAKLPTSILDEPNSLLPEIPCWVFLDNVARAEGIDIYGVVGGGAVKHFELDSVAPLLIGCHNLNELLHRFIVGAPFVSNSAGYSLESSGSDVWFVHTGCRLREGDIQAQIFQVLGMMQLVQLAAGADWRPEKVHFTFPYHRAVGQAAEFNPSRICFSQPRPAILLPRRLLARPISLPPGKRPTLAPLPSSVGDQLADLLLPYFGTEPVSKEMAAEIVGLSPRTMQRRLADEYTNFAQLTDRIRLQKAQALLEERHLKLIDISLALGYENAPSFTRAFRRWTGVSPREYRRWNLAGESSR